jgi:hypothetical protein
MRLVKLTPVHGFAAETAASGVLLSKAALGFPVSPSDRVGGDPARRRPDRRPVRRGGARVLRFLTQRWSRTQDPWPNRP